MQSNLSQLIPTRDELLAMPPAQLAGFLIVGILRHDDRFFASGLADSVAISHGGNEPLSVKEAVMKALSWLISESLVIMDYNSNPGAGLWFRLTQEAKNLSSSSEIYELTRARQILPHAFLHEIIRLHAVPIFLTGKYDTAIFEAFKQLEIRIRDTPGCDGLDGVALIKKAFNPSNPDKNGINGALTDLGSKESEQQGMCMLFTSAFMVFRNPTGHQNLHLNAQNAAEILVFASHLIGLVEGRQAKVTRSPKALGLI